MSKRIKKVYNTKLLYRYSLPLWFTIIFALIAIAGLAVSLFYNNLSFTMESTGRVNVTTLDVVLRLFNLRPYDSSNNIGLYYLLSEDVGPDGLPIGLLMQLKADEQFAVVGTLIYYIFLYAMPILAMLSAIFFVVVVIMILRMLVSGALTHWKGPFIMSLLGSIFGIIYFGGEIAFAILANNIYIPAFGWAETSIYAGLKFDWLWPSIYAGTMFIATVILGVIYNQGFYGKQFIPNKVFLENFIQQMNHGVGMKTTYTPQPIIINTGNGGYIQPQSVVANPVTNDNAKINDATPNNTNVQTITKIKYVNKPRYVPATDIPQDIKSIGGHAFAKNINLLIVNIPDGITALGPGAFANCVNIKQITLPKSVKEIGYNCFFNCASLEKIFYAGSKADWAKIKRGNNWLAKAKSQLVSCSDGLISVNPIR